MPSRAELPSGESAHLVFCMGKCTSLPGSGSVFNQRHDVLGQDIHGVKDLLEAATSVEVDLELLDTSLVTVAFQVRSHLFGATI